VESQGRFEDVRTGGGLWANTKKGDYEHIYIKSRKGKSSLMEDFGGGEALRGYSFANPCGEYLKG